MVSCDNIFPPGKMIVIRNPDEAVSVGVSAPANAHGRRTSTDPGEKILSHETVWSQ